MHPRVDATQLLNDETPASRRLERDLELPASEPAEEPSHALTVRRRHTSPTDLTRLGVEPLRRDLRSVLIQSHYDRHQGPPQAPWSEHLRELSALELRRPSSCHLSREAAAGRVRSGAHTDRRLRERRQGHAGRLLLRECERPGGGRQSRSKRPREVSGVRWTTSGRYSSRNTRATSS